MHLQQAFTRKLRFAGICLSLASFPLAAQDVTPPGAPRNVVLIPWDDAIVVEWERPDSWGSWDPAGYEIDASGDTAGWVGLAGINDTSDTDTRWVHKHFIDEARELYNGQKNVQIRIRAVTVKLGRKAGERSRYTDGNWALSNKVNIGRPWVSSLRITPRESQLDLAWATRSPRTDKTLDPAATAEEREAFEANNRKYVITKYYFDYTASRTVSLNAAAGTDPDTGWVSAGSIGGGSRVYSIRKLKVGVRYRVRVRAVNGWGSSQWIEGSAVVPGTPKVLFNIHEVLVPENDDYQDVKLVLNQVMDRDVTVTLSTTAAKCNEAVTATEGAGEDYTLSAKSFTFARGTTNLEQNLRITPREDRITEGREAGCVSMVDPPASANFEVDQEGVYLEFIDTSKGSEAPPLYFYDYPVEEHDEGDEIPITLSLNTPRTEDVNVTITVTSEGTASTDDYTVVTDLLTGTIKAGLTLYDSTGSDSKSRKLLTLVDDSEY